MASYTTTDPPNTDPPNNGGTYVRKSAYSNGGTFDNTDLLWYAKGVGVMMSRSLDDPSSWWFFAAIHGQEININGFPGWGFLPSPPQVPTTPLPSQDLIDLYWDQCQHQSWFFPPWHRGYLIALEGQVRAAVISLGGPSDWALPYWNYLGPGDEYELPPALAQATLPDGTPNALFVKARYGPNMDGNVFVEIPPVSGTCENNNIYTGNNTVTPPPGFGGRKTGFSHSGAVQGNLESNPHNLVHVDVGGVNNDQTVWGLMSDPNIAALDPVFYMHHCNIDRMWAAWNAKPNDNPTDTNWLNGPPAVGQREFAMPLADGTSWVYTPDMVKSLSQLDYTYDDLTTGIPEVAASNTLNQRLTKLGASPSALESISGEDMDSVDNAELVGASEGALQLKSSGARTSVRLDAESLGKVSSSLESASESLPDHVYLQLENVRGNLDAFKLKVSVNNKDAGTIGLFGLRNASSRDGEHGGEGLTFVLDITNIVDNLFLDNDKSLDLNSLDVKIRPNHAVPDNADISIGRVSIYRQGSG